MFKENHYVPIIRWKRGEQSALLELDESTKDSMTPLIEVAPVEWDFENECYKKTIDEHIVNFSAQIQSNWNHSNPVFIDAIQICIDDEELMENDVHPLEYLFTELYNAGIAAIPVTGLNRGHNYQSAVKNIHYSLNSGIALRLTEEDFDDIDSNLTSALEDLDIEVDQVDIVLDYKYIDPQVPAGRMATLVVGAIQSLPNITEWRTLTFAATSFPTNLSQFASGTDGTIPRSEWLIYKKLFEKSLPRYPAFGDYNISNPEYARIDPRFIQMSANIRYTADDEYLIFRGYSVRSPKYGKWAQAQTLCLRLVAHPKYFGQHFSYGDNYIFECAEGTKSTGNAETWRKVGTNHHLKLATLELSNFHAALSVGSP